MDGSDNRGSSLTIVIVPSRRDPIWKISSEKVPHITLMYLGDQSKNPNLDKIVEFVGHVVSTSMTKFDLGVDSRGTLGDDEADVVFFSKEDYVIKKLAQIRHYLLADRNIFEAYNSIEQYPEWTPHLTLGYPENPAKIDVIDGDIRWIDFDRVEIWTGSYEGPGFDLDYPSRGEPEMAMGDAAVIDFLSHYGIKGMKWGVRKEDLSGIANLAAEAQKFQKDPTKTRAKNTAKTAGGLHNVSDKELKDLLNRMDMERRYKSLMEEDSRRRKQGAAAIGKILGEAGKVALPIALSFAGARYAQSRSATRGYATIVRPAIEGYSR